MKTLGSGSVHHTLDAARLSEIAKDIYVEGGVISRKLQHWRPYICPFERLIGHVQKGSRVLDVGCGAGLLLCLMAALEHEFEGVGFDVSQRAIDLARRAAERMATWRPRVKLSFECLDPEEAWPHGTFDVVFLIDVLHHIRRESKHAFLRQAISKLNKGGVLVYKDMCRRPWWKAQANRIHDLVIAHQWISYVPVEMVERWAQFEGKGVIVREDLNRFWYGHELRIMI
jgi:2-polyprenyl-3-methyl-5-hydroxy-6-metoxy-1,4-benzoquinol methylase